MAMADIPSGYPLAWPPGWPRTTAGQRQRGQYRTTLNGALENLRKEVRLLCGASSAQGMLLSSNVTLGENSPADPGVVAFFLHGEDQVSIPCDRWSEVAHNIQAIAMTIESMRAIERHGAKHMVKAMFRGFTALAAPSAAPWRSVLGIRPDEPVDTARIRARHRELAAQHHPDRGGSTAQMAEINTAVDRALKEIGT